MSAKLLAIAAPFYHRYIELAPLADIVKSLKKNEKDFLQLLKKLPAKKQDYAYAEGKWTIREMLQHIIDAERVFAFRAIWIARKSNTELPGFDENQWAADMRVGDRDFDEMLKEFKHLRKSTIALFDSLDQEELLRTGIVNGNAINVAAIGYICAGHIVHHIHILRERYW
jgi:uncharacterized damage-inducible protein DinB